MDKYELIPLEVNDRLYHKGLRYQVKALKNFAHVKKGDLGGYVYSEHNLSQEGDCWLYHDARIEDNARVEGNAKISGTTAVRNNAKVYGNAIVCCSAQIWGNAKVFGNAEVSNDVWIYGDAEVYDDTRVYGHACIYDDAKVFGNARVGNNARLSDNTKASYGEVLNITHGEYNITITDEHIKIGCRLHTITEWLAFTDEEIATTNRGALKWWKQWKPVLKLLVGIKTGNNRSITNIEGNK